MQFASPSISLFLLVFCDVAGARPAQTTLDPFVRCEAEDWSLAYGISINACTTEECDYYVGNINNGDFMAFYQVDFQSGATGIELRVAADVSKYDQLGQLHIHVDNITTVPFCSIVLGNTGDLEGFVTVAQFIEFPPDGVHDLFFTFSTPYGDSDIGNIDWFQFFKMGDFSVDSANSGNGLSRSAFDRIQASEWDYQEGVTKNGCFDKTQCDYYVGYIQRDDVIAYYGVDFQDGATGLTMSLAAYQLHDAIGSIYFRLDNTANYPFATVVTGNTGGEQAWTEVKQFIGFAPVGVHDLYLTFKCNNNSDIGNVAWFQFFKVE